jgi:elongation factor G
MDLFNHQTRQTERFNNLFVIDGHQRNAVDKLTTGDIGATLKLKDTHVNDTLSEKELTTDVQPMQFPESRITMAVSSEDEKDAEKISEALHKLTEEDPTLIIEHSKELKQLLVGAQGELHLSVIKWYLENVYGLNLKFETPRISYRETINKPAEAQYRHKKQSGGAGQFAEVSIKIEPFVEGAPDPAGFHVRGREIYDLEWGGKLEFINCIVGGAIDARFIPSILKGIMEKMESGPLTKSPIRDVRVILYDGKMHSVDSNDLAFKLAGLNAFKEAFMQAAPSIMEPMYLLEVRLPEELLGDVLTDLQSRRGSILKIDSINGLQLVEAKVPLAEMDRYSTKLQSLTQGRARFSLRFDTYETVNNTVFDKLVNQEKEETVEA